MGYKGTPIEEISTENIPPKKKNLLNDPSATQEQLRKEINKIREENEQLERENGTLKTELQQLRSTLREESNKMSLTKVELEKKLYVNNRRGTIYQYEANKQHLDEKYLPKIADLKETLQKGLKKLENLEQVFEKNTGNYKKVVEKTKTVDNKMWGRKKKEMDLPPFLKEEEVVGEIKLALTNILLNQSSEMVEVLKLNKLFEKERKKVFHPFFFLFE